MRELDYRKLQEGSREYQQVRQEYEMQERVLKCFDRIVVISEVVKESLKNLFGITEGVVKIPNSVDGENIRRRSGEQVQLPEKKIFSTLGRLDYNKNQMLLLKAAREVRKERTDFCVYLLGDGDEREHLETYIREHHLQENAKILGFVENPYPYIKGSIATVLTSFSEGFSLALVESVMLDTPIISTDVGVARELVEKYGCGDIIDYDEQELAAMMLQYLKKYDGHRRTFDIGSEYDIGAEVQKTEKLIAETLEASGSDSKLKRLPYPEMTIREDELEKHEIRQNFMYVLRVMKDGVPYEYLIHRRSDSNHLIVFHNGAVVGGNVKVPVFQRHSWAKLLKTSAVFCMDPTLYINSYMQLGWGVGKNDNYYLENSSLILKKIIRKMDIELEHTAIYGTSAGGYLSIITGIYLKGAKVVADNAQLDVRHWIFKDALDAIMNYCFDNVGAALIYKERFDIVDAFEKHEYVPKIYMHVNLCSVADNSTQLIPFLQNAEKMRNIKDYRGVEVILHYEPDKGHDGLSMEDGIAFLYKILGVEG
jgi:hypothetical protein